MATLKLQYDSTTSLTVTGLSTLVNNAAAVTSNTVDNTTNLFVDVMLEIVWTTSAAVSATGTVEIWAKGSIDNSDFDDDSNDKLVGIMVTGSTSAGTRKRVFELAAVFGGTMPPYWQIRVKNTCGANFTAATASYRGALLQSV